MNDHILTRFTLLVVTSFILNQSFSRQRLLQYLYSSSEYITKAMFP